MVTDVTQVSPFLYSLWVLSCSKQKGEGGEGMTAKRRQQGTYNVFFPSRTQMLKYLKRDELSWF